MGVWKYRFFKQNVANNSARSSKTVGDLHNGISPVHETCHDSEFEVVCSNIYPVIVFSYFMLSMFFVILSEFFQNGKSQRHDDFTLEKNDLFPIPAWALKG